MSHELRNIPNASHETLTRALIAGGIPALVLLILIGYLCWRGRKSKKTDGTTKTTSTRTRKKRRK